MTSIIRISPGNVRPRKVIWGLFPLYFHRLKEIRPLELACLRIVLTSLAVWVVLAIGRDRAWFRELLADPRRLALVALAGLMVTINWLIYVWAAASGHVVDAAIGYFINPLISVALGVFVLHERLRPAQKVALTFGGASVCVLTIAYGNVPWVALSLACSFGLYGFLKKTTGLDGVRALAAETFTMADGKVQLFPVKGGVVEVMKNTVLVLAE